MAHADDIWQVTFNKRRMLLCRHNGQALGYEPWWRGFNESWLPTDYIHLDNLMRCVHF
jgi:hypothetical protein